MPQLHLYVPDDVAIALRERARERGISVSRLLAEIVTREERRPWPEGWLETVVGAWPSAWPSVDDPPPAEREPI